MAEEVAVAEISVRPDGVGVICIDHPAVNAFNKALTNSFVEQFAKLEADPKVKAIVVTGKGGFFSGGFDLQEFQRLVKAGKENYKDVLQVVCNALDGCSKTTVAALNGPALGGGFEVALACHYRVAAPKAVVAFPEVSLGFLPGAQGTQRLPRVSSLGAAADAILSGSNVRMPEALKEGMVDAIASGNVVDEAAACALSKPPSPVSLRTVSKANMDALAAGAIEAAVAKINKSKPGMAAYADIATCLKAACTTPFKEGVAIEAKVFVDLLFGVQAAALRHMFYAERAAPKVPGISVEPKKLTKVGILGAGLMGGGIAMCFAQKGIPVILKDAKQEWLDDGMKKIVGLWEGQAKRGRLTPEKFKQYVSLITPTLNYSDLGDVDAVIEAVPEIMPLKQQVFKEIEANTKPDAFLWTNTSGLNIDEIAAVLKDPSRCMGAHFFSPANVMQLLENVRCAKTSDACIATAMKMGTTISKKPVLVGNCDGFVGNRMVAPYIAQANTMLEEGASVVQINQAAQSIGMAMGPMSLQDLVGQELFWKQRKAAGNMKKQTKTYYGPYEIVDWLCEQNRFGLKTPDPKINANGRGLFIYKGKTTEVDPEVVAKVGEVQKMKGITPKTFTQEEILERLFFPMINEGFKILEEGYATRPSDIDVVYCFGYGFPQLKGGPMFYAEKYVGLPYMLERLKVYAAEAKAGFSKNPMLLPHDYFEPSPLLEACVAKKDMDVPAGRTLIEVMHEQFMSKL
mmetsp:Transcript_6211/g.10323  ORF Transcript_6211/g.10323 Transcript_6211/m.10323 type:complete len:741 (-) Transcript_6211:79-2301(-)